MKQFFVLPLSFCLITVIAIAQPKSKDLPRIAIASFGIESSTFSPARTNEEAFHPKYGNDVFKSYPFLSDTSVIRKRAVWFPTVAARSLPGGAVTRDAYESIVTKIIDGLKKDLPYDGMFLDIHGAMSVSGLDDPEGDFITRIRKAIGFKTIISTSMDLHGNVSQRLAENSDLITCYRMAPHEDAMETKQRSVMNLLNRIESGKGKPLYKVRIPIPVLLPGEKTSTRIEPAKSIYKLVAPATQQDGIIDAGIWVGYPWADEPRNHAVVVVTGDNKEKVMHTAEMLAKSFWDARKQFAFVAPSGSLNDCLAKAFSNKTPPFFISDSGDNPTAGGAGDVTWTLREILNRSEFKSPAGPSLIYASIPGPRLVEKALAAGIGAKIEGVVGAEVDARYAPPLLISGTVESIKSGDRDAEVEVVVKTGNVNIIVTRKRKPYHKEADFTNLGLKPRNTDIVVVKIGYLEPELYAMQKGWMLALTPGGVDQDLERLDYKRIQRPMFPLDKDMPDPILSAQLVPLSDVQNSSSILPPGLQAHQTIQLKAGDLDVIFVDNSAFGPDHRQGYNGIASLRHIKQDSNLFVPLFAGFNLEHIYGGDSLVQLFEPRRSPMTLYKKSDTEVILYQSPTPLSQVESSTSFRIVPPHYIDITFNCVLKNDSFFRHGYAGVFWASYIHSPEDRKIYFLGKDSNTKNQQWIAAFTPEHGVNSTHKSVNDNYDLYFDTNFNATLASHYSSYNFTQPFYYGRFRNMAFAYLFEPSSLIRFSQSPNGGGDTNPAWDLQFIIPKPVINKVYSYRCRLVYKPFTSAEDILKEFEKWRK